MDWTRLLALCAELDASGCSHDECVGRAELLLLARCQRPFVPMWAWFAIVGLMGLLAGLLLPVTLI